MAVWKDEQKGYWIAKFQYLGKQYKREGFEKRQKAVLWEGKERQRLRAPTATPQPTPSISLQALATGYLTACRLRLQFNTFRQKIFVYRTFISFLGTDVYADSITKKDIEAFLHECLENGIEVRPVGTKTVNRYLRDLKALYNWALDQDIGIFKNPCRGIEKFPETPSTRYIPPAEDVDKVMMAADREQMDLLTVLYHTLGRISEVLRMKWEDVNFENQWVRLYTRKRRGGELQEDYLPMNETLSEVLSRRHKGRNKTTPFVFPDPLTGEAAPYDCKMMKRLCKKAGVKAFGFHAIRHHVASVLNDSGKASMKQIQQLLRHKRQSTTEGYLHSIGQDLRDAARLLEGKGGGRTMMRLVVRSD